MYDYTILFSYPVVSGDATFGELVPASKLTDIAKSARDNLVETLADLYRGASGNRRSGVLTGLTPARSTSQNMTVNIGEGAGLYYADILGTTTAIATGYTSIRLADPDATNPRYDLVVARADGGLADYATRQVKLADGTFSTSSLPGRYKEGIALVKFTGTPAGSPTIPSCSIGDIPLAAVYVPAGSPGIMLEANVHDVRPFLMPRSGVSEYRVAVNFGSSTITAITETTSDPAIKIEASFQRLDVGSYVATLRVPLAHGANSAGSAWLDKPQLSGDVERYVSWGTSATLYGLRVRREVQYRDANGYREFAVYWSTADFADVATDPDADCYGVFAVTFQRAD